MLPNSVAIFGLGLVGKAMAGRLLAAGFEVTGWDTNDLALAAATNLGVEPAPESVFMAVAAPVLLLSLPDSEVVGQVLWDEGLAEALPLGVIILDTTTGRPDHARQNSERLADLGVKFVDVALSGSSEDIAAGQATALIGDAADRAVYRPIVEAFASRLFFLGQVGRGCLAKLVVNLVMGLNRAALAEGLALGEKAGLPGRELLEVLRGSAAYSRVMDTKGERMVERHYDPASRLNQHAKDVRLILDLAAEVGAYTPLEQVHADLLRQAQKAGWGGLDNATLIEVFRQAASSPP
jgi:3-hydroxyisobutyrate dehydrogenase-like beta-hydroxyacid dehydrogenase